MKFNLALGIVVLGIAGGSALAADPAPAPQPAPAPKPQAPKGDPSMPALTLTEAQRAETARTLEPYRERIREASRAAGTARRILFETIHQDPMNETAVREAARRAAACEEELAVLRAQVAQELRRILTPAQREAMNQMVKRMADAMERRASAGGSLVDAWVEENRS